MRGSSNNSNEDNINNISALYCSGAQSDKELKPLALLAVAALEDFVIISFYPPLPRGKINLRCSLDRRTDNPRLFSGVLVMTRIPAPRLGTNLRFFSL